MNQVKQEKESGSNKAMIYVYTRTADSDSYPAGLANSIHIAVTTKDQFRQPLHKNYGILFAKGLISEKNTIIPMGVKNPKIFYMPGDVIGIIAERIHENGEEDENSRGKVLLWKTKDFIHFEEGGLINYPEVLRYKVSDMLAVEEGIVREAIAYWSPIRYVKAELPKSIPGRSPHLLDDVKAELVYSDGSRRTKRICFEKEGAAFSGKGKITQQSFSFPLAKGYGDPVIFPWEGKWYFIATNDNLNDIGLYVREAKDVQGLFAPDVAEHLILPFDPRRNLEQTFWAPEFHVIGGELYILFAVSGHAWGPQCHLMKLKRGGKLTDADAWEDPIPVRKMDGSPLAEGAITLDMTYVKAKSGSYVIWSYREHICSPLDTGSMLYIASIDEKEPWRLTSEPVLLSRPLYGWENVSGTINNEGPYAFVKDDRIYVTYSGGAANGYTYALGLLTANTDADLLQMGSWSKSITPVLTFYSVEGHYGPGHNSFFVNDEGELMIAYHAETDIKDHLRCDAIRRVHFRKDGTPYFEMSREEDITEEEITVGRSAL